jgi:hypothetical protein
VFRPWKATSRFDSIGVRKKSTAETHTSSVFAGCSRPSRHSAAVRQTKAAAKNRKAAHTGHATHACLRNSGKSSVRPPVRNSPAMSFWVAIG